MMWPWRRKKVTPRTVQNRLKDVMAELRGIHTDLGTFKSDGPFDTMFLASAQAAANVAFRQMSDIRTQLDKIDAFR